MSSTAEKELMHYGVARRSGRYPWGSGKDPYQHSGDFLSRVDELRKQGFTFTDENGKKWTGDSAIAKSMDLTTSQFRTQLSLANAERRALEVDTAKGLREKGYSLNEIAEKMGYKNDSSVRSLLNETSEVRMNQAQTTATILKEMVDKKGMVDVGAGSERELNVSKEKLQQALYILEMEGYPTYGGGVPQATNPGRQTNLKVLCPPGTEHKEIYSAFEKGDVHSVKEYDKILVEDGAKIKPAFVYPASMDSKRLQIRYADDPKQSGAEKDGVIELRRGVEDLSLGKSKYAQVRILVDNDRYLKGMAVYSDNLPDGVDVLFNTNKNSDVPMRDVLKKIKPDPDNPFGSLIKEHGGQSYYIDKDGNEKLSLINKRAEEGDWGDWADKMSTQVLAKQNMSLIKKQINLTVADRQTEFEDICSLSNPTVKRKMLNDFADDCDAAAVHLKTVALPRQKWQVIMPITSMKDTEVYAPQYRDGETVALIRTPHAGIFEIPILTVNNKHPQAKKMLGNAMDAVGINFKVAERLSGADFDGDTVMVIPTNDKIKISSSPRLKGLIGFDPKMEYGTIQKDDGYYNSKGQKITVMKRTNLEMGEISNLITDMTIRGATSDDLARAVRHSMVVIDAEKHKLDYKQSERDNGIAALKKRYQGRVDEDGVYRSGASTIFSRAKNRQDVLKRQGSPHVNQKGKEWYDPTKPEGSLVYKSVIEEYTDKNGKKRVRTQQSSQMKETDDAYSLVSEVRNIKELEYANYANRMKSLANAARMEAIRTGNLKYSASAAKVYSEEVASLKSKLNIALKNAPRERQAQLMAYSVVKAKKQDNPELTKKEIKKLSQQELAKARVAVGAKRHPISVNDREWEAIQSGAVSDNVLTSILKYADMDDIRQKATPRSRSTLSATKITKLKSMNSSGNYTIEEIARSLGVSTSVVNNYLRGKE